MAHDFSNSQWTQPKPLRRRSRKSTLRLQSAPPVFLKPPKTTQNPGNLVQLSKGSLFVSSTNEAAPLYREDPVESPFFRSMLAA